MDNAVNAFRPQHRGEHSHTVAIGSRSFVSRQWLRFGAHHHRSHVRRDLDDPLEAASKILRLRSRLTTGLRQMLIPDPVLCQQLPQNTAIELRPPRPRNTPHIAQKLDLELPQQFKKIIERMPSVADGVNC